MRYDVTYFFVQAYGIDLDLGTNDNVISVDAYK
jgi:hypothetical protein